MSMLLKLPVNVRGGRRGTGRGGRVNNGRGRCVRCRGAGHGRGRGRGVTVTQRDDEEWQDGHDFQPSTFQFEEHVGVKADLNTDNFTELQFVNLPITDDVLKHLIEQTNLYAKQYMKDNLEYLATKPHARAKKWKETNKEEMKVFLEIVFLMGLDKRPELQLYQSTNRLFFTPVHGQTMSYDRFLLLLKYLHFDENQDATSRC